MFIAQKKLSKEYPNYKQFIVTIKDIKLANRNLTKHSK